MTELSRAVRQPCVDGTCGLAWPGAHFDTRVALRCKSRTTCVHRDRRTNSSSGEQKKRVKAEPTPCLVRVVNASHSVEIFLSVLGRVRLTQSKRGVIFLSGSLLPLPKFF